MLRSSPSGNCFYRNSTIRTTIASFEANNDTYYLQKRIEKFPLIAKMTTNDRDSLREVPIKIKAELNILSSF